jgi:CheY-like chemotaxis protein
VPELRVLLVDDEDDPLVLAAQTLSRLGLSVTTATSMEDALRALGEYRFDVVISDLSMGEHTGFDLAKAIRALRSDKLPLLALSNLPLPTTIERARSAGFDGYIQKPAQVESLRRALEDVLSKTLRTLP